MRLPLGMLLIGGLLLPAANAQTAREKWLAVADRLASTPAESYNFDWGEGVQMSALMQAHGLVRNERYADFVEKWARHHLPAGTERLMGNHPDSPRKGFCGIWVCGNALMYLHEARKKPEYRQAAAEITAFIRAGAQRSPEGLLGHWVGNFQVWVDTFNMACPLLSRMSVLDRKPELMDDAVNQLLASARHLRDEKTGLYYHMWDWQFDRRSPVQWGRGNGWVIMSLADTFEFLPKSHPRYSDLKKLTESYAASLLAAQGKDNVWHTLMNDTSSPAESSATSMVAYGFLKLVRLGVLPAKYRDAAQRAWTAVNDRWVKDGLVTGVSEGTLPLTADVYLNRKEGTFTWGTGAYLMAGAEMERLGRR